LAIFGEEGDINQPVEGLELAVAGFEVVVWLIRCVNVVLSEEMH